MKTRNGFVSNSSSSSFVILGKKISLAQIDLGSGKKYMGVGKSLYDGRDVFEIKAEMLDYLRVIEDEFGEVYEVVIFSGDYAKGIEIPAGTYDIVTGEADHYSSNNLERLIENYQPEPEELLDMLAEGEITTAEYIKLAQGKIDVQEAKALLDDGLITSDEFVKVVAG